MSALCGKACVKHHRASRLCVTKRQGEEVLLRNSFKGQAWIISETKPLVVLGGTHENTALCPSGLEPGQPFVDERFPDALPLVLGQHGDRTQAVPMRVAVGHRDGRERDVAHHVPTQLRHQRDAECPGGPQGIDDELFRVIAVRARLECRFGDLGTYLDIGFSLVTEIIGNFPFDRGCYSCVCTRAIS